jgi:hypothetical protein
VAVESKSELVGESVLRCELEAAAEGRPAAVPGQELASVSAYRPEVVELSAQDSAQRLVAALEAANRPAVAEKPEVEEQHPWTAAVTKAGGLSRWRHSQAVSMAVATAVIAVVVEPAILAVAAVRARCALVAKDFAAVAGESKPLECTIEAVARLWRQAQKPWARRSQTPAARPVHPCCPALRSQRPDLANAGRLDLRSRRPGL